MGKLARIAWPREYSELQRIEELLLCGICYDYMDTSVMTPCSHNYCSLCIRKYLHYKTQCPACFEKTFEKDLHTNRILDELISYFGRIREKLVNCIAGAKILAVDNDENVRESPKNTPVRPVRVNQSLRKTPPKPETNFNKIFVDDSPKTNRIKSVVTEPKPIISSPSTSEVSRVATIFTPKSKKTVPKITNTKTVPCPVCAVDVSELHINKHLDDCLKRETASLQPAKIEQKRKTLPKLVFSLMKDTELRKKMKELGLPSQGDRKTLESRFQRYSVLYNAECDKKEPRTIEELLKICENEENMEKKMLKFAQAVNRLKITRSSEQNIIEEAQKKYLETNRENYHNLIASMKEREKSRKTSVRRSLIDQRNDNRDEMSSEVNGICDESNDPVNYSMNAFEATFQDSDSENSCPLQHYASDDPMKFLSLHMSTDDGNLSPRKTPSKSAPTMQRINEDYRDLAVSSSEKLTPRDTNGDAVNEDRSRIEKFDVYNASTDIETSEDDDAVPPSPKATTSQHKRPKLSLVEKTRDNGKKNEHEYSNGRDLAMSIARDFTFDSSSNDSLGSAVNEIINEKFSENASADISKSAIDTTDSSNLDKENQESSTSVVNRPVRKRNCVARSQNVDVADSGKIDEKVGIISHEDFSRSEEDHPREDVKLACTSRKVNSPLKRRRRRKVVTPDATETTNPPRRPLRKRHVNSNSTENARKRS